MSTDAEIGFDRISTIYDALSWCYGFGAIQRSRRGLLPHVPQAEHVLVLGDGTGLAVCELFESRPPLSVVCVDLSSRMLGRLRQRLSRRSPWAISRLRLVQGGIDSIPDDVPYDLIISHYFLDLFNDGALVEFLGQVECCLRPGGSWWVTDFAQPSDSRIPAVLQESLLSVLYRFFRLACGVHATGLPDIERAFHDRGWTTQRRMRSAWGSLESTLFVKPIE